MTKKKTKSQQAIVTGNFGRHATSATGHDERDSEARLLTRIAGALSSQPTHSTFAAGTRGTGKSTERSLEKDLSNHNKYCHFCQHVKVRSSSMLACGNYECSRRYCEQCLLIHLNENATEQLSEGWSVVAGKVCVVSGGGWRRGRLIVVCEATLTCWQLRWFCPICRNKCCCAKSECSSNHRHCKAFRYRLCRAQKAQKRLSSQSGSGSKKARGADMQHQATFVKGMDKGAATASTVKEEDRAEACAANPFFVQEQEEFGDEQLDFGDSLCGEGMAQRNDKQDEAGDLRLWDSGDAGDDKEQMFASSVLELEHVIPGALTEHEADEDFEEAKWLRSTLEGLGSSPSLLEEDGLKEEGTDESGMKALGSSFLERFQSELKPRRGCTVIYDYV
eukprot:749899-Hanusia_phi.AAC.2